MSNPVQPTTFLSEFLEWNKNRPAREIFNEFYDVKDDKTDIMGEELCWQLINLQQDVQFLSQAVMELQKAQDGPAPFEPVAPPSAVIPLVQPGEEAPSV